MRWFVEVSRVGDNAPAEHFCIDAKAWQAALQEARKLRGDAGPLSKFSIELLDDGYRAVDPVQKIRYLVNQAPADAPLVTPAAVNAPNGAAREATPVSTPAASSAPAAAQTQTPSKRPSVIRRSGAAHKAVGARGAQARAQSVPAAAPAAVSPAAEAPEVADANRGNLAEPSSSSSVTSAPSPSAAAWVGEVAGTVKASMPASSASATLISTVASSKDTAHERVAPPRPAVSRPAPAPTHAEDALGGDGAFAASPAVELASGPNHRSIGSSGVTQAEPTLEFQVFRSRLEAPTPETPITYREVAYAVAPGSPLEAVEVLLRERLQAVRLELATHPAGQLVQLAVFDHVFEQRPLQPPLGTLAWKDWRGEPVLGFPAFGEAAPPLSRSLPPLQTAAEDASPHAAAIAAAHPQDAAVAPPASAATGSSPFGAPRPSSSPTSASEPSASEPSASEPSASEPIPLLLVAVAPAATSQAVAPALPEQASAPLARASARPGSVPDGDRGSRPRLAIARRRAGEDLIAELFELMHELHFARDIASGADFVQSVLSEVLPSEVSILQVFDINTRRFVVVRARGGGAEGALLLRTSDKEPLTVEIMRREGASVRAAAEDPRYREGRWSHVKVPLIQVLSGAVRQGGRYLGTIELANPLGGAPFHQTEINAFDYICQQFADFVASRPVVLDADAVLGR